jgi:glutamine cyclotransferase
MPPWRALAAAAVLIGVVAVVYVSTMTRAPDASTPTAPVARQAGTPVLGYEVVREYPHDRAAFTQGLIVRDGFLYESTGQYGQSTLRKVELETGRVVQRRPIDATYFAEGLTAVGRRLLQLTWKANVGFVYDLDSFEPIGTFRYPGEGWGLTYDGRRLIMSDGTAQLRFLDPDTWEEQGRVTVMEGRVPVSMLNELEYVDGEIYANVWGSDRIAIIDPDSGRVGAWVDLAGMLRPAARRGTEDVLNGIAYDAGGDRLFVTGKYWPTLFEIRVRPDATR